MTLVKLVGIVFCFVFIILLVKNYRQEYVVPISVCAGAWLFFQIIGQVDLIFNKVLNIADIVGVDILYIEILLKIIGISYICEFASAVCADSGQTAFGVKIDLAGKLLILSSSIPIFTSLIEIITAILP